MKFKVLLFTIALFTISLSGFSKPLVDSIGVKNNDGKKMVLFKVKAKDTYYSIGHRYNIKPEVLMKFNGKKKAILSIGTIVEVPTDEPFKESHKKAKKEEVAEAPAKETKAEKKERLAKAKKEEHAQQETAKEEKPQAVERPVAATPAPAPVQTQQPAENNAPTIQYKVSPHETMYGISKRFNMTVDELSKLNNLNSTTLTPGQILMVRSGGAPAQQVQQQVQPQPQQPVQVQTPPPVIHHDMVVAKRDSTTMVTPLKDSSNADRHNGSNRFGLYEKNEKGVATWIDDASLDPTKKLVLHRIAPIGTVIKITNPMTNRTTFAKVVGRFTDNEATKDVIIVMTKNVADALGAYDKRFRVSISYGSPNE